MRILWIIAGLLIAASVCALFWPRAPQTPEAPPTAAVPDPQAPGSQVPDPQVPDPQVPAVPLANAASLLPQDLELIPGPQATVTRIDNQTVLLDGAFTVRGSGSQADPYRISWELLGSARAGVEARAQRCVLPGRLSTLQDAWVEISGYWAPPLMRFETRDISLSLNKWDGCCIGVKPTPFDSIEVQLTAPINIVGQHLFRHGTVRGRMHIQPFAAAGFLLGLYRIDEATLESS